MVHFHLVTILLFIPLCSQQDISFPTYVQDDQSGDTELLPTFAQQSPTQDEVLSSVPQNMIEINSGKSNTQGLDYGYGDDVSNAVLDLSLQIQRKNNKNDGYWVFSPISISAAMYMLLLGSYSKTYSELSTLLKIKVNPSSLKPHEDFSNILKNVQNTKADNVVKIANGVFVQQGFNMRQDYRDIANVLYKTQVEILDFVSKSSEARKRINSWVKKETKDKIQEVLTSDPPLSTKMVLVNSLYFKADWEKPFSRDLTKLHTFYPNGRSQPSTLKVQMMANQGTYKYYKDKTLNLEIVGLPYKGDNLYMYIILPQDSTSEKINNLVETISGRDLQRLLDNTTPLNNMIVAIPRLNISTEANLVKSLKFLGVQTLFNKFDADMSLMANAVPIINENKPADIDNDRFIFTRSKNISVSERRRKRQIYVGDKRKIDVPLSNPGLYVDTMLHQVVMEVHERGTEAAAVTTTMISRTVSRTVKADAPYLLVVRHEPTRVPLLLAGVTNPPHSG